MKSMVIALILHAGVAQASTDGEHICPYAPKSALTTPKDYSYLLEKAAPVAKKFEGVAKGADGTANPNQRRK